MKVLKFGGSSVGSPESIGIVKSIVEGLNGRNVMVVSAFQGITDQLIRMATMARMRDEAYKTEFQQLSERHFDIIRQLIPARVQPSVLAQSKYTLNELEDTLKGIYLLRDLTLKTQDFVLSFGERLSAYIISNIIDGAVFVDSRELIITDSTFGNAKVDFLTSEILIREKLQSINGLVVMPGFIASNANGETTTLGRGGSDYTAAIIASAVNAEQLEIWTDVDGFMTADPRKVSKAYAIEHMTYAEAIELSHFGAKVIYTPTIQPVYQKNIPILIKNTFNLEAKGTLISNNHYTTGSSPIKGISSIDDVNLITVSGPGMVGVTGTSMRLFGALAAANTNIILITQASSEFSITFAIRPEDAERAMMSINKAFEVEILHNKVINVDIERELSIIAIVGERMKNMPGISASLFRSLGRNGISVIATAQGSSELNISVAIKRDSLRRALNAIHEGFFLSAYKELHLFVVGVGTVGGILLKQICKQQEMLMEKHKLKINVMAVANSRKMLFTEKGGLDLKHYANQLANEGEKADIDEFIARIKTLNVRNSVFIDCTANEHIASKYKQVLDSFTSVVTANKIACSSAYENYLDLKQTAQNRNVRFYYETNVGAGLPIINTINDLIISGDRILKLEAVLSGTLNFIFNTLSQEIPLSETVRLAKEKGFSEPDPRIDLSGVDVVRKILILSREAGYPLEFADVEVNTFLPAECFKGSIDDFWKNLSQYDAAFEVERKKLSAENKKWRFVAKLDNGKASVGLQVVDINHPAYSLEGSNNIVLITTERYNELPMIIKGYGAGAEVTAAGMFADIIRVANV